MFVGGNNKKLSSKYSMNWKWSEIFVKRFYQKTNLLKNEASSKTDISFHKEGISLLLIRDKNIISTNRSKLVN